MKSYGFPLLHILNIIFLKFCIEFADIHTHAVVGNDKNQLILPFPCIDFHLLISTLVPQSMV